MYIGYGFIQVDCRPALDWSHHDAVAVVVVCYYQVVVAAAGRIRVDDMFWFCGGQEAGVCPCCVARL